MDNQEKEVGLKNHEYMSGCAGCRVPIAITQGCVRCLMLYCSDCISLTPKGPSCGDCYVSLFPEVMFTDLKAHLTREH